MHSFDPLAIPLTGQQLVEASAGTGKTYSIAQLYLRFILEGDLDVDNILVVTFTTSATEELRQRIRARLSEALDVLKQAGQGKIDSADNVLDTLLSRIADRHESVQRLTGALARMDESAIFTIHSFCQRMLQDHAFESGAPFGLEFLESEHDLRIEILQDFWRQGFTRYPRRKQRGPLLCLLLPASCSRCSTLSWRR
jgi:exodeoxyribonuclease V beta subunit